MPPLCGVADLADDAPHAAVTDAIRSVAPAITEITETRVFVRMHPFPFGHHGVSVATNCYMSD